MLNLELAVTSVMALAHLAASVQAQTRAVQSVVSASFFHSFEILL